ncbi:hypothetical protein BJF88_12790 [Cellulosimicrobium sp. CUA-896]|nr:hypothetical protein BJF88_12790 [Cellulosimicrobium sp. CUA-896]
MVRVDDAVPDRIGVVVDRGTHVPLCWREVGSPLCGTGHPVLRAEDQDSDDLEAAVLWGERAPGDGHFTWSVEVEHLEPVGEGLVGRGLDRPAMGVG